MDSGMSAARLKIGLPVILEGVAVRVLTVS
jgi:hypothetical protein